MHFAILVRLALFASQSEKRDFTADMQQEAERLKKMTPRERKRLAKQLRRALGKDAKESPKSPASLATPPASKGSAQPAEGKHEASDSASGDLTTPSSRLASGVSTRSAAAEARGMDGINEAGASRQRSDRTDSTAMTPSEGTMTMPIDHEQEHLRRSAPEVDEEEELNRLRSSFGLGGAGSATLAPDPRPAGRGSAHNTREPRAQAEPIQVRQALGVQDLEGREAEHAGAAVGSSHHVGGRGGGIEGRSSDAQGEEGARGPDLRSRGTSGEGRDRASGSSADSGASGVDLGEQEEEDRIRRAFGLSAASAASGDV